MLIPLGILLFVLLASIAGGDGRDWIRGFMPTPQSENTPLVRCVVISVASTSGHLDGHLLFINESDSNVAIDGETRKDGTFWPSFRAEAKKENEKEWRTLGDSVKSQSAVAVTIEALSEQQIWVDMDMFRPAIAKATFGRIVLSNGISAMFNLELFADH
jgi:hypothetical protein